MTLAPARPDPLASNEDWAAAGFVLPGPDADYCVVAAAVVEKYTLRIRHRDGVEACVHFKPSSFRGVLTPLCDPKFFKKTSVEHGAVGWPGDIDIAPDNMHRHLFAFDEWVLQ